MLYRQHIPRSAGEHRNACAARGVLQLEKAEPLLTQALTFFHGLPGRRDALATQAANWAAVQVRASRRRVARIAASMAGVRADDWPG